MSPISYPKGTTNADVISDIGGNAKGKTILITGVSPGTLGAALAISLAPLSPAQLILFSRKEENLIAVRDEVVKTSTALSEEGRIVLVTCDLSSQESVRRAVVDKVLGHKNVAQIDVVVNSASPMLIPFEKVAEGVEMHWAVNQVGPFALFNLLLYGAMLKKGSRVLNLTSGGYISAAPLEKEETGWEACKWEKVSSRVLGLDKRRVTTDEGTRVYRMIGGKRMLWQSVPISPFLVLSTTSLEVIMVSFQLLQCRAPTRLILDDI